MELLKHIQELAEPSAIINDAEAVKFIFTARENFLSSSNPQVLINLSIEHDFDIIAINLINFLHKEIVECISKTDVDLLQDQNLKELLSFSCNFITLIRYLTIYSDKFCNRIHQIDNSLNVLFDVIQNKQLLDFLVDLYHQNKSNKPELLQQLYFFVRELVGIILNLSKVYDSYSDNWKQLNAVKIVLDYSEKVKDIKNSKIGPCLILANIVDENEINQYAEIRQILIPLLCKVSAFCAQNIKKKSTIYLKEIGRKVQVGVTKISNCEWNIVELMNAICKLAVRDDLKQKIYNLVKTELIEKIISNGNQIEAVFGLKLLFQLCFDKNIAKEIRENEKLLEKLNDFKIFEEVNDKELIRNVNGIVWLLNFYESQSQEGTPSEGLLSVFTDQVMISCNGECREDWGVCSKIKQDLEESNYKVWMEQTTNYDAMSRAIEESFCVLICMTDKYKKSAHCRSEAEFAYERKKPIIPLLLQDKYFPDGWLCHVNGGTKPIDFAQHPYDKCLKQLKKEIDQIKKSLEEEARKKESPRSRVLDTEKAAEWSEEEVLIWLQQKNINELIQFNILPCDGKLLYQLHTMQKEAPEFFYSSINEHGQVKIRDVAFFTRELRILFGR